MIFVLIFSIFISGCASILTPFDAETFIGFRCNGETMLEKHNGRIWADHMDCNGQVDSDGLPIRGVCRTEKEFGIPFCTGKVSE
jgi:hypothetical protein